LNNLLIYWHFYNINREDFVQIDGLSNNYWGWGLEDDEFYLRLKEAKIGIHRPGNLTTGTSNTFRYENQFVR